MDGAPDHVLKVQQVGGVACRHQIPSEQFKDRSSLWRGCLQRSVWLAPIKGQKAPSAKTLSAQNVNRPGLKDFRGLDRAKADQPVDSEFC